MLTQPKLISTVQKHKNIFILYTLLIKKKGDEARFMTRGHLYDEIAQFFYTDKQTIGRIISNLQRQQYTPNMVDKEEFFKLINDLIDIIGCQL